MTDAPLSLVREPDIDAPVEMPDQPPTDLPSFEGDPVTSTKAKITSVTALEIGDRVFKVDESVKLIVEAKVVGVQHQVEEKTGLLHRVHVLKAMDTIVIDWTMDMDAISQSLKNHTPGE